MNPSSPHRPTILVVDDEPFCRESLAELLTSCGGFQARSAGNADEALGILHSTTVDLAILDVNMPGKGGVWLLQTLRALPEHSHLPVILLTDNANRDVVRQIAGLRPAAYLLKSAFSSESLFEHVRSALRAVSPAAPSAQAADHSPKAAAPVTAVTVTPAAPEAPAAPAESHAAAAPAVSAPPPAACDRRHVLQAVEREIELQPFSAAASLALRLISSPGSSIHEIVDTIRNDGALALRVMRVANSCLYSTGNRATSLLEAAGRLGLSGLRNAVATVAATEDFAQPDRAGLSPQRAWEHALAVGVISQAIAAKLQPAVADDAYLAGLWHDLGRLVLSAAIPDEFARAMQAAREQNIADLTAFERATFGLTHADVTRHVLQRRGLPDAIVNAASLHEQPADQLVHGAGETPTPLIVALANRIAHALAFGDGGSPTLLPFDEYTRALGLDGAAIAAIGRSASRQLNDAELTCACFSDLTFKPPLPKELAALGRPPRGVRIVAPGAPYDPLSLFIRQIGWTVEDRGYDAALVNGDLSDSAISELEAAAANRPPGRQTPLLLLTSPLPGGCTLTHSHRCIPYSFPIRYSAFIQLIMSGIETKAGAAPPPVHAHASA